MKIETDGWVHNDGLIKFTRGSTTNQSGPMKKENVRIIVAHWTGGHSANGAMAWLSNPAAKASAHFVVGRSGELGQLVSVKDIAWHAGESSWSKSAWPEVPHVPSASQANVITGINKYSIGIEFVNLGKLKKNEAGKFISSTGKEVDSSQVVHGDDGKYYQSYTNDQIETGLALMMAIKAFYPDVVELIGHSDIAPTRKTDPGPEFPFAFYRARLFGRHDGDESVA